MIGDDGYIFVRVGKGKIMEIKEMIRGQRTFFETGRTGELTFRKRSLLKLREAVEKYEDEIVYALHKDLGKNQNEAFATEIGMVYSEISYMLKHLHGLMKEKRVPTSLANFKGKSRIYSQPYGVVLIMSPWNYPFQLTMVPLIGALAAGNCAVVKPSAYAPETAAVVEKILTETFRSDYVHVVRGGRKENENLLEEKFDYIFFTGGKNVGRTVMEAAAKHLTPVTLELGGKSPCIVDETADIAMAARRIAWGKFLNCGQTCVAPDYVLVHETVKEKFLAAMVKNIEALYGENPIDSKDYGKIINRKHFHRLDELLAGESPYYFGGADEETCKIGPILLDDVTWQSRVMEDEIFGPVLPVLEFSNLKEVKAAVNSRPRPLALYLFTKSKEAERYVIRNIPFGGGCINDTIMHLVSSDLPFGGIGESGMGSYHGKYSFRTFSHEKSILKKCTLIDMPLRYPPFKEKNMKWLRLFLR